MGEAPARPAEALQREHYDRIHAAYAAHYGDPWSQRYRQRFMYAPLLDGVDLRGAVVLEAMCGDGATTAELVARGAHVIGLDISAAEIDAFRQRWPDCEARCASILDTGLPASSVDAIVIVGGLHHLHPDVRAALAELRRVLRPGGFIGLIEPHAGSLPDRVRAAWYRVDRYFAANEAAIDIARLLRDLGPEFAVEVEAYKGNVAYLVVLNSLILRIPLRLKAVVAPALLALEAWIERLQTRRSACFAVVRTRKRALPAGAAREALPREGER